MVVFARRRERRAFAGLMSNEVGSEVVTTEEFHVLRSGRRRRRAVRAMKRSRGPAAAAVVRRLMREQMNLALFHARSESEQHPAVEAQRAFIMSLKQRLAGGAGSAGRAPERPDRAPVPSGGASPASHTW